MYICFLVNLVGPRHPGSTGLRVSILRNDELRAIMCGMGFKLSRSEYNKLFELASLDANAARISHAELHRKVVAAMQQK